MPTGCNLVDCICFATNWCQDRILTIFFMLQLPDECEWAVWVDPPPPDLVGRAFETLHDGLEASWLKSHRLEKRVTHLREKKKKLKLQLQKKHDQMETWAFFMIIVGICILSYLFGSKNAY